MARILRGDIMWADLNPVKGSEQAGLGPVLILSQEVSKKSWVKISQIRTLSVERLGKKIGKTSPEELHQIVEGLNEIIGD